MNVKREELGELVRGRRRHLGVSQMDLAALTQVAVHTVSDIESGKGNPTLAILLKILDPLGLELCVRPKSTPDSPHFGTSTP
ncbi:MAG: helix-turn-helix domain-containing protein [Verrucomicrobia bacterium]|nr:helix-turn-helix domain-containing protein [Verrucomicrobiota bacterium]